MTADVMKAGIVMISVVAMLIVLSVVFGMVIDTIVPEMLKTPMHGIGARLSDIPLSEFGWALQLLVVFAVLYVIWFLKTVIFHHVYSRFDRSQEDEEFRT